MLMLALLLMLSGASALSRAVVTPLPQLANVTYYGSACPEGGLSTTIGPFGALNATASIAPLTFTLSNFTPTLGSFGSSLRMCDITATVIVDPGWKTVVNARGTQAQGYPSLNGNSTMSMRGTYQFAENFETQSVGMLSVDGPLSGQFVKRLQPADGDQGVVSPCTGGELVIEFMAMAVSSSMEVPLKIGTNETTWTFGTDIEVVRC